MYCLDTYALVEIEKGSPSYQHISDKDFIIPSIVLAEFCHVLSLRKGDRTASYWFRKLRPYSRDILLGVWMKVFAYRKAHRKENLSMVDVAAYLFAKDNDYTFVTGDKAFENKKGVKYIK